MFGFISYSITQGFCQFEDDDNNQWLSVNVVCSFRPALNRQWAVTVELRNIGLREEACDRTVHDRRRRCAFRQLTDSASYCNCISLTIWRAVRSCKLIHIMILNGDLPTHRAQNYSDIYRFFYTFLLDGVKTHSQRGCRQLWETMAVLWGYSRRQSPVLPPAPCFACSLAAIDYAH